MLRRGQSLDHHLVDLQLLWQAPPAKSSSEVEAQILAKIAAIAAPERYNAAKGGATKVWTRPMLYAQKQRPNVLPNLLAC